MCACRWRCSCGDSGHGSERVMLYCGTRWPASRVMWRYTTPQGTRHQSDGTVARAIYDGVWVDAQAPQRDLRATGRHVRRHTRAAAAGPASQLVHAFVTLSNSDQGSVPWRRPSVTLPSQELRVPRACRADARRCEWVVQPSVEPSATGEARPRFTPRVRATGAAPHAIAQPRQPHATAHTV